MNFAASNIGLTAYDHESELKALNELGISGIEIAPSRVWSKPWRDLRSEDVTDYRLQIERSGLRAVGLHSLFFDQPRLGLFKNDGSRAETLAFMIHLSKICRDLGGKTLIYGGGRRKFLLSKDDADKEAVGFFSELIPMVEEHGTCFCFEPLGPHDSDYINSVYDSIFLVEMLDSPCLRVQLDAKALVQNNELEPETFQSASPHLVHFHANEPDLGVLGGSGEIDHRALGRMLHDIGYSGYVSIEQKLMNVSDPIADLAESARVLREYYG